MYSFKLPTELYQYDTFPEFIQEFALNEEDLLVTNAVIFDNHLKGYNLPCHVIFQENYGYGEPNDKMIQELCSWWK
ncbi:hypothetical protein BR63_10050 [Thermanaerosceptrum fracticalcis]|uniref:Uncharacterized protein n=1 Tax=Thermanaerosceptrum fracticalcis TaxID=1712410 RepID=A0A7G6E3G4_THEFR|nr:hypothetical protein [Thermanaerosceptrum fracticalcis]QNB46618.1 hypothetical protein BR63_10050 [Thermanaerosceptrum fracticalcis]